MSASSDQRTPLPDGTLVEVPVLFDGSEQHFGEEDLQHLVAEVLITAVEPPRKKRLKQKTERLEITPPFDFKLPADYVPVLDDEYTKKLALGDKMWLPLAKRLKGWVREVRRRANGWQYDKFYNHNESGKKCRTFLEVKRYVYLGFTPVADNGDTPLSEWAVQQPDPMKEGDPFATKTAQVEEEVLPPAMEEELPPAATNVPGESGPSATPIIIYIIDSD